MRKDRDSEEQDDRHFQQRRDTANFFSEHVSLATTPQTKANNMNIRGHKRIASNVIKKSSTPGIISSKKDITAKSKADL